MTKLNVVPDTNVYLSGILFGGNSRHILDLVISKKIVATTSPQILLEISEKLDKKFKWDKDKILTVIKTLAKTTSIIKPKKSLDAVKADKNDNKIIEAAAEAKADDIITGDKHLLDLEKYQNIKILAPADFLSLFLP